MSDKLIVYLDTSALVKWYLVEANSDQVTDYIIGLDRAIISTFVNQHAKITRERVESTLKSFHPKCVMIRHFVGVPWGVINGPYSRNQATPFY
jgi:uncharacterized protein YqfA (UPF0365 family)